MTKTQIIKAVFTPTLLYQGAKWTLTSKERQMLTTTEMRCLRKAAGKTRIDKLTNEEIRRRVNMQPAEQTANKTKIRWRSHIESMTPTVPQIKARRTTTGGRPRNRWEDYVPRWYNEMGIPMTDVNNWIKEKRPIVYPLDADDRRVRLKVSKVKFVRSVLVFFFLCRYRPQCFSVPCVVAGYTFKLLQFVWVS